MADATPLPLAELWVAPDDLTARDLFFGPGGRESAPVASSYTWVETDSSGFSPGYTVRDGEGRTWSVKLGPEAQSEVVASRVLWAIGYHQPSTYYVREWTLAGGPGGTQPPARFRLESDGREVAGEWSWRDNAFVGTQPFHGLITANVLLNSWDWKTSNNKIYRVNGAQPSRRFVVQDLGASLGSTSPSRLLWVLPVTIRGFGQGSRNDIAAFESRGFIETVDERGVEFDFDTVYGDVVRAVRPADVRWTAELLNRVSDEQWDAAFRAAEYSEDIRARYIRKIKAKIAEGLAVS